MNKFLTLLLLMATITLTAQKKTIEKSAKKITKEMTEVMSLSDIQSADVYEIQLEKIKQSRKVREENIGDKEAIKKGKWKIQKASTFKLIKLVGKEKFAAWREYYKAKVDKSKK
ncbi:hypothetical protein [Polaribacter atrinae]|uniref:hypothetical protein n=1 Tax=Polaribacter atrinae TaxID=1333662 RepID=UPI0024902C7B|nr:hypothetical protein [Polaribacter atrinae]